MKRKRKNIRFFRLPELGKIPRSLDSRGRTRFDFERVNDDLQVSITHTINAEDPDLVVLLNRDEVESILAQLCAYLLNRDTEEIQTMAADIAQEADVLEGE